MNEIPGSRRAAVFLLLCAGALCAGAAQDAGGLDGSLSAALRQDAGLRAELASLEARRLSVEASYARESVPLNLSGSGTATYAPLASSSRFGLPFGVDASLGMEGAPLRAAREEALAAGLAAVARSRDTAANAAAARILSLCIKAAESTAALEAARERSGRSALAQPRPRGAEEDAARVALLAADLALDLERATDRRAGAVETAGLAFLGSPPESPALDAYLRSLPLPEISPAVGEARAAVQSARCALALEKAGASAFSLSLALSGDFDPLEPSSLSFGLGASLAFSPKGTVSAARAESARAALAAAEEKLAAAESADARGRSELQRSIASAERRLELCEKAAGAASSLAALSKARLEAGAGTAQDYAASLDLLSSRRSSRDQVFFELLGLRLELLKLAGAFSPLAPEAGS